MNRFIVWLLTASLAINHMEVVKANLHYSYNKEDHNHHHPQLQQQQQQYHHQLTPAPRRIYKVADFDNKENNQASKLKMANTQSALAHEAIATYNIYGGKQPQLQQPQLETQYQQQQLQLQLQPTLQAQQHVPQQQIPSESYSTKYPSIQYNVLQHIDDGDIDIVYHETQPVENYIEATQQEKPSLLDQLKSQQQELSEGYATFLQETPNGSSGDNEQQQQQQHQPQVNPLFLHYQKLQQQQQLYYQQLQQQEQQQQHAQQQQEQQQYQQVTQQQQYQQVTQQQPSQHHLQYQQQQLQQQEPPHATAAYVTPTPPPTTPAPVPTTTQATKTHPNLHHRQQPPAIVSHDATGNEASPPQTSAAINPHPKPYQRQPPHHQQRNKLPTYATAPGFKYVPHNKPYNHLPPPRVPATVYGPPPLPHGSKHSKQVIYAPMRFVYDRKLPYSTKTFPYPPSFISLTTTEKPMKYDHGNSNYYTYDHKAAYNKKMPDFFVHRSPKSLLDSYIPSWQVIKMLQQLQYPNTNTNQNTNLHTLAQPFRRNFKRNAGEQGQQ